GSDQSQLRSRRFCRCREELGDLYRWTAGGAGRQGRGVSRAAAEGLSGSHLRHHERKRFRWLADLGCFGAEELIGRSATMTEPKDANPGKVSKDSAKLQRAGRGKATRFRTKFILVASLSVLVALLLSGGVALWSVDQLG